VPGTAPNTTPNSEARGVLPAGSLLLDYEIISVLGQGGFGITYLAHDRSLGCRVAIKEYLPASIAMRDGIKAVAPRSSDLAESFVWGRERFLEEACTLAKLGDAPSIVRINDLFEANNTAYTVMELAKGETLRRLLLRRTNLTPSAIERLFSSLLEGLEVVHTAGLLHHDIRPANIIVDPDGNPTLVDFSAARASMAERTAMVPAFSPNYAAAEQFTSEKQGPWTDIYGLSATLYHAITGAQAPGVLDRMLEDAYRPLTTLMPAEFSAALLAGIDAGLRLRASERPKSIAAWRSTLPSLESFNEPAIMLDRLPPAADVRPWAGLAAALVVVVLATDSLLMLTGAPPETAELARRPAVAEQVSLPPQSSTHPRAAVVQRTALEATSPVSASPPEAHRKTAEATNATQITGLQREVAVMPASREAERVETAFVRRPVETEARVAAQETARRTESPAEKPADSKPKAEDIRQQAEKAEAALNLPDGDRRHVQAALTAVGYEVPATGYFGPITRGAIATWQTAQGLPGTGFLDRDQLAALYAAEQIRLESPQAEASLNLSEPDRKRVQAALTTLGQAVPTTGYFGSITRGAISAWQKTQNLPATGYLTEMQLAALQQQAATVQAKNDQVQAKAKAP
jgi:serine/threonine protein kinase/peptidoglycan hydrolase-like protein with peptidoglycan-binding domain